MAFLYQTRIPSSHFAEAYKVLIMVLSCFSGMDIEPLWIVCMSVDLAHSEVVSTSSVELGRDDWVVVVL